MKEEKGISRKLQHNKKQNKTKQKGKLINQNEEEIK